MKKAVFTFLTLILLSGSLFSQTEIGSVDTITTKDTVYQIDTVYKIESVYVFDTIYNYDTTLAVQKQLTEIKSNFYDKAMEAIDFRTNMINLLLAVLAIGITLGSIYLSNESKKSSKRIDDEIRLSKEKIDLERKSIALALKDIKEYKKIAESDIGEIADFKKSLKSASNSASDAVNKAEKKADDQGIVDPKKRIELIDETDAQKSIEEYEKLLFDLKVQGLSNEIIPTQLHKTIAKNYLKLKNYDKAIKEYSEYLANYSNDEDALLDIAFAYYQTKNFDKAIEFLEKTININNQNVSAYYNWGVALTGKYKHGGKKDIDLIDSAIEKYQKATEINNQNASAYFNLACAFALINKKESMLNYLKISINLNSRNKELAREDDDFDNFRDDEDFNNLVKE